MKIICPSCKKSTAVRKILYGMPSDDFDFEKYEVGGCLVDENNPTHFCRDCEKPFLVNKKKSQGEPLQMKDV